MEIVRQLKVYNHKVIPILTETETKDLIRWHKSHTHLQSVGSKQDYMGVRKMHIQNEYIRTLFQKVENHCLGEIFKATGKVFTVKCHRLPVGIMVDIKTHI